MWYYSGMESGQRVVVYVPQETYRTLKGVLAKRGETVSGWFRGKVAEELTQREEIKEAMEDTQKYELGPKGIKLFRCSVPGCGVLENHEILGKVFDTESGEWKDVPMCARHAARSLQEFIK